MKKFTSILFALISLSAISQTSNADLMAIIQKLQADEGNTYLRTLAPTEEECLEIMMTPESGAQLYEYSSGKYATIDQVPEDAMKALTAGGRTAIIKASKEQLLEGDAGAFPEEYTGMAAYLAEGQAIYGMQFVNTDREIEKTRSAFFKTSDRWVLIPLAYRFNQ